MFAKSLLLLSVLAIATATPITFSDVQLQQKVLTWSRSFVSDFESKDYTLTFQQKFLNNQDVVFLGNVSIYRLGDQYVSTSKNNISETVQQTFVKSGKKYLVTRNPDQITCQQVLGLDHQMPNYFAPLLKVSFVDWFKYTQTRKIALAHDYISKSDFYLELVNEDEFKIFSIINENEKNNQFIRDLLHEIKFGTDFDHNVFQLPAECL